MSDDLIKRLERWGASEGLQNHFIGSRSARRDCEEAAAALSDAQATIARLEGENARLREALIAVKHGGSLAYAKLTAKDALSQREGEG